MCVVLFFSVFSYTCAQKAQDDEFQKIIQAFDKAVSANLAFKIDVTDKKKYLEKRKDRFDSCRCIDLGFVCYYHDKTNNRYYVYIMPCGWVGARCNKDVVLERIKNGEPLRCPYYWVVKDKEKGCGFLSDYGVPNVLNAEKEAERIYNGFLKNPATGISAHLEWVNWDTGKNPWIIKTANTEKGFDYSAVLDPSRPGKIELYGRAEADLAYILFGIERLSPSFYDDFYGKRALWNTYEKNPYAARNEIIKKDFGGEEKFKKFMKEYLLAYSPCHSKKGGEIPQQPPQAGEWKLIASNSNCGSERVICMGRVAIKCENDKVYYTVCHSSCDPSKKSNPCK